MIRPARFQDIPALKALVERQHAASKYAGRVDISAKALDQLLMGLIAAQGQTSVGAGYVAVAERDGAITGFIAGSLNRVYNIGNKLTSSDVFFINEGDARDTFALFEGYVAWAKGNPKVLMVGASWSDALPGAERLAKLYERKGFSKIGELFEMQTDASGGES